MRNMMTLSAGMLILVLLVAGCTVQPWRKADDGKVKVQCPACGTDFDALLYKQF